MVGIHDGRALMSKSRRGTGMRTIEMFSDMTGKQGLWRATGSEGAGEYWPLLSV